MQKMNQITCIEDKSNFTIKLGGKNSIDAEAYSKIIDNAISLLKASVELVAPDAYSRLEIEANSQGSFLTSLTLLIQDTATLFDYAKEGLGVAGLALGTAVSWIKIKQHLNGENKKTINYFIKDSNVAIINNDGKKFEVDREISDKFFEDKSIDSYISKLFTEVNKENRESFEVIPDKNNNLSKLTIKHCDFGIMSKNIIDGEEFTHIIQPPITQNLLIKQVDFIGDSSWSFIYNKIIKASIKDKAFLERIRTGEIKLGAGYQLNCSLQIEYDLHKENILKDSEKYTILEVFDVLTPAKPEQKELFEPVS